MAMSKKNPANAAAIRYRRRRVARSCAARTIFCVARKSDCRLLGLASMCVSPTLVLPSRLVVGRIGDANQAVWPGLDGIGELSQVFRNRAEIIEQLVDIFAIGVQRAIEPSDQFVRRTQRLTQ